MHLPSRNLLLSAFAVLTAVSLSACVLPYRFTDAPAVAGQVVSGTTHQPVAGAIVSMTSFQSSTQTHTDQVGEFRLPALKHWGWIPYPTDGYIGRGVLRVESSGCRPYAETGVGLPVVEPFSKIKSTGTFAHDGHDLEHIHVTLTPGA